jgi:hypothetical protein
MNQLALSPKEIKEVLTHIVTTNKELQEKNIMPLSANIVGPAGIGKTSIIKQLSEELGIKHFVKLSLSQIDELGDLVGFGIKEYQLSKKTEKGLVGKWVAEKLVDFMIAEGWKPTGQTRMGYAEPEWIAGKEGSGVLLLDDFTRASQRFIQACMELIDQQEYISWKLPKGWTIILSTNPEDGDYQVSDVDPAQRSRYLTFEMKTSKEDWVEWAFNNNIDQRCIAFVQMFPEVLEQKEAHVNPRSLVKFFNSISSLKFFSKKLPLVQMLGESSVGTEITINFTQFIHNNLDRLKTAEEILDPNVSFSTVESELYNVIGKGTDYRADIANVLTTRLMNYLTTKVSVVNPVLIERISDLIKSDVLGTDLKFVMGRKLINSNKGYKALLTEEEVMNIVLE